MNERTQWSVVIQDQELRNGEKTYLESADPRLEEVRDMACSSFADDKMAGIVVTAEVETES